MTRQKLICEGGIPFSIANYSDGPQQALQRVASVNHPALRAPLLTKEGTKGWLSPHHFAILSRHSQNAGFLCMIDLAN